MLSLARMISKEAHKNQIDKGGNNYFLHPQRVSELVDTEDEKIVAYFHDVIEDTDITLDFLKNKGFSSDIINAVDAITKRKNEPYDDYISRVCNNLKKIIILSGR